MACPRMECSADRENRPWMLKRVQHDESGGRGLPPAPFPFSPISCNSVAMTSSSSQKPSTADPTARLEALFAELQKRFRAAVSALKSAIAAYVPRSEEPPSQLQSIMPHSSLLL